MERDKMKRKTIVILVICLLIVLGVALTNNLFSNKEEKNLVINPVYWVLSDTHFISPELYDTGEAFEKIKKTSAGKELEYQKESLQALVDKALNEKPAGIIITGDLTLNGEKKSAEELAKIFHPLEENGIQCLVIPGNHDIQDGWAREFKENNSVKSSQISADEFKKIFDISYKYGTQQDDSSLSYLVNVNEDYQFLMLDTNIYSKLESTTSPRTKGEIKPETMRWIEKQLQKGQENQKETVVFMHHNLLKHNEVVYEGFVLNNNAELQNLLNEYHVSLVFSGHIHAKSVKKDKTQQIREVVSPSYSMTEQLYGELSLSSQKISYEKKRVDVDSWAKKEDLQDPNLLNYREFTKNLFVDDGEKMAYGQLIENGLYLEEDLDEAARFVGQANWRYFTGNNELSELEIEKLKTDKGYQVIKEWSPELNKYLDSIIKLVENPDMFEIEITGK